MYLSGDGSAPKMKQVVKGITTATSGRIHLLIGTHEHWNHLSCAPAPATIRRGSPFLMPTRTSPAGSAGV
jgi:hypothetical protein